MAMADGPLLDGKLLARGDSETSAAIIAAFERDSAFLGLSKELSDQIVARDNEDGDKLQKGIQIGIDKKVLPADVQVEPICKVSVTGKTADEVSDAIIKGLGDAPSRGCVMTLQGLSGTGKGTTVAKLAEKLPSCVTWSNGNVFRSLTLLALTYAEQQGKELKEVLTPELLADFCTMLSFDKYDGRFDVKIEGLGLKYFVSAVEKTVLKDSKVGKNIPTVAEVTQGEVINFVQDALGKMAASGMNVLLEGREQTLNYIRTPHRFELVLDDPITIGMRQAALRMGAKAHEKIMSAGFVKRALEESLTEMRD